MPAPYDLDAHVPREVLETSTDAQSERLSICPTTADRLPDSAIQPAPVTLSPTRVDGLSAVGRQLQWIVFYRLSITVAQRHHAVRIIGKGLRSFGTSGGKQGDTPPRVGG